MKVFVKPDDGSTERFQEAPLATDNHNWKTVSEIALAGQQGIQGETGPAGADGTPMDFDKILVNEFGEILVNEYGNVLAHE